MKNLMTTQPSHTHDNTDKLATNSLLFDTGAAEVETHPFGPVLPPNATVMMMGTFPPTADKWAMRFHYPNFYNDMWRIYGSVFFDDVDYFGDKKIEHYEINEHVAILF